MSILAIVAICCVITCVAGKVVDTPAVLWRRFKEWDARIRAEEAERLRIRMSMPKPPPPPAPPRMRRTTPGLSAFAGDD